MGGKVNAGGGSEANRAFNKVGWKGLRGGGRLGAHRLDPWPLFKRRRERTKSTNGNDQPWGISGNTYFGALWKYNSNETTMWDNVMKPEVCFMRIAYAQNTTKTVWRIEQVSISSIYMPLIIQQTLGPLTEGMHEKCETSITLWLRNSGSRRNCLTLVEFKTHPKNGLGKCKLKQAER